MLEHRLLAIDPSSTRLGYAHNYPMGNVRTGEIVAPKHLDRPARFNHMRRELQALIAACHPKFVLYYRPFARGADATRSLWGIAALIEAEATAAMAGVTDVSEASVRSFFGIKSTQKGKARREELKQMSIDTASELCHNEIESDDIAEAVLLLHYLFNNSEIKS